MAIRASDRVTLTTLPSPSYVRTFYRLQDSTLAPPSPPTTNPPPAPWSATEPAYTEGSTATLYTTMLTAYGSVAFEYGAVQKSSSFEAAKQAYNLATASMNVANLANAAAAGMVKAQQTDPGHQSGRIWLQLDDSGRVIAMKVSNGTAWQTYALMAGSVLVPGTVGSISLTDGAVTAPKITASQELSAKAAEFLKVTTQHMDAGTINVDRLNAGTFRGKVIEGATVIASDSTGSDDNVTIGGKTITVNRSDVDGGYTSLSLGGDTVDTVTLQGSDQDLRIGLYGDTGNGFFSGQLQSDSLYVGGDNVLDVIGDRPRGIISKWEKWDDWHKAGSNEIGVAELYSDTLDTDRIYRIVFDGLVLVGTPGDVVRMTLRARDSSPDDPATVSSTAVNLADFPSAGSQFTRVHFETLIRPTGRTSYLFTMKNQTANRAVNLYARGSTPAFAYIEDLGKQVFNSQGSNRGTTTLGGGTPLQTSGGGGTAAIPTQYVREYAPTWRKTWYGSSTSMTDYLHHGYYGGTRRYSMVGFGGSLASDLAGATIVKAEIYLANQHWWGSTGTAYLSPSDASSAPSSADLSGAVTTSANWPKGGGRWVPINWSTNSRAVTLGNGAPTSTAAYGKFAWNSPRLRLTYRK